MSSIPRHNVASIIGIDILWSVALMSAAHPARLLLENRAGTQCHRRGVLSAEVVMSYVYIRRSVLLLLLLLLLLLWYFIYCFLFKIILCSNV
jgi:hypothetical protein